MQAQWAAREHHLGRHVSEQPSYSMLQRGIETHVLPPTGLTLIQLALWSPLSGVWLRLRDRSPGHAQRIIGPRTPPHLASQLAAADTVLTLDAIDEIVPPGTDLAPEEKVDTPPALLDASLRRR